MPPETPAPLDLFTAKLEQYDKQGAVEYALSLLEGGALTVSQLYEQVLAPSLNQIDMNRANQDSRIWREHLMSSIVRAALEMAWPYVLRESGQAAAGKAKPSVLLVCPEEEYHELGARMGADFFAIAGYGVFYIGCNTPRDTLLDAVRTLKPELVNISVTNYLNLAQLPPLIAALKAQEGDGLRVILSGSALRHAGKTWKDFGADGNVNSFADIQALKGASV